jgi:hypothetical protein
VSDPGVYSKLNTSHHRGSSVFCFVEDWALSSVPDTVSVQRGSEEPPLDLWANEPVKHRVDGDGVRTPPVRRRNTCRVDGVELV